MRSLFSLTIQNVQAKCKTSGLKGTAGNAWIQLTTSPHFASVLLAIIMIWEFGILLSAASGRLFWYDELCTSHVSGLQPFSIFWKALKSGADVMPLGYNFNGPRRAYASW